MTEAFTTAVFISLDFMMLGSNKKRLLSKDTPTTSRKRALNYFEIRDESSSDDGDIVPPQFRNKSQVYHVVARLPSKNAPTEAQSQTPVKTPVSTATRTAASQTPTARPQAPKPPASIPTPTPAPKRTPSAPKPAPTPKVAPTAKPSTAVQRELTITQPPTPKHKSVPKPAIVQAPTPKSASAPPKTAPTAEPSSKPRPANTNPHLAWFEKQARTQKKEINTLEFEQWLVRYYAGREIVRDSQDEEDVEEPPETTVPARSAPVIRRNPLRRQTHILDRLAGPRDRSFVTYATPHRVFTDGSSDFVAGDFHPHSTHFAMSTSVLTDMYNRPNNLVLADVRKNEMRCLDGHKVPIRPVGNATINPLIQGAWQHSTVADVKFARDGRFLCSGGYDKTFRVWDTETGECVDTRETDTNVLVMSKVGSGSRSELIGAALQEPEVGIPGRIRVYGIGEDGKASRIQDLVPSVANFQPACLTFDPSGSSLVAGFCGANSHKRWGGLVLFDIETAKVKHPFLWSSSVHSDVFWHPSTNLIVAASTPRKYIKPPIRSIVRLLREGSKKPIMELGTPQYDLNNVSMSPCGNYVTASGTDNCTLVWDIRANSYRPLYQLEHGKSIHSSQPLRSTLVFNERRDEGVCGVVWLNNRTLLSGGTDGVVKAWDLGVGKPFLKDVVTMQSCVTTFKMSPDGMVLAVGDGAGHIKTVATAQAHAGAGGELPKFKTIRVGGEV